MKKAIKILLYILLFFSLIFIFTFGYIKLKVYLINKEANDTVLEFKNAIEKIEEEKQNNNEEINNIEPIIDVYYNNYKVIGTVEIPSLNLAYPIIDTINQSTMKKGIIILYGNNLNDIGNTVLAGHAYLKGTYFSNINKLKNGDKILITDASGKKITYYVYDNFETDANDISFYEKDTDNLREITLSTCNLKDEKKRHIIFAKEKPKD